MKGLSSPSVLIKESEKSKFKRLVQENRKYFRNPLSEFVFFRTYSRFRYDLGRREVWEETVDRFIKQMKEKLSFLPAHKQPNYDKIKEYILHQKVMPSMRLMWSSGGIVDEYNPSVYNCSYTTITDWWDFAEIPYLLYLGTGVGFSVESKFINKLPVIRPQTGEKITWVVEDNMESWARSYYVLLKNLAEGRDVQFDYSKIRPAGSPLHKFGGRASGPEVLRRIHNEIRKIVLARQGQRLRSIDVYDIITCISDSIVAGGVRRVAIIVISDLDDELMRLAKNNQDWWQEKPYRSNANISAVYESESDFGIGLDTEFDVMTKWKTGERGIFNRYGLKYQIPQRRLSITTDNIYSAFGTNPCGEIILRDKQFCNLSEVIVRPDDTKQDIIEKIKIATLLGTYQTLYDDFAFISSKWHDNTVEERLLGVSITGIFDNPKLWSPKFLQYLKQVAIETNAYWSHVFGINQSTGITAIKPSGTVSLLCDTSSGLHPRWAKHYYRRVRINSDDPLAKVLMKNIPMESGLIEPDAMKEDTLVINFVQESPEWALTSKDISGSEHLKWWLLFKQYYTEHNPSVTVYVDEHEWDDIKSYIRQNKQWIGGVTFLEKFNTTYPQMPLEAIAKQEYLKVKHIWDNINIDYSDLIDYDSQHYSISPNGCEGDKCLLD